MSPIEKKVKKLKDEGEELGAQVKTKTIGYIAAALGLVAGLAWNDAIRALIEHFFPLEKDTLLAKFIYAVLITLILIVLTTYIIRLPDKDSESK